MIFTADWHIKLGQKNVPKEWARSRYLQFFDQIPYDETHIIGGDIFDKVPTLEELSLFINFLDRDHGVGEIIIFDGNHEATKRGSSFMPFIRDICNNYEDVFFLFEPVNDYFFSDEWKANFMPYTHIHQKKNWDKLDPSLPVFTHVRGEIPPHVKPEIPLEWLKRFPVVFAGDLHSHTNCQQNIVYPGTPYGINFTRQKKKYGYLQICEETWEWEWKPLELPQLLRLSVENVDQIKKNQSNDHIVYELEGDVATLRNVKDSENLEKKIIRSGESGNFLKTDSSIEEVLKDYLIHVQSIPANKAKDIVKTFNDNVAKAAVE